MARENQHLETIWGPTTTQIPDRSVAQGIEDITATGELLLDAVPRKTPFLAPPCTGATAPHGCGLRHGALALARYRIPGYNSCMPSPIGTTAITSLHA